MSGFSTKITIISVTTYMYTLHNFRIDCLNLHLQYFICVYQMAEKSIIKELEIVEKR